MKTLEPKYKSSAPSQRLLLGLLVCGLAGLATGCQAEAIDGYFTLMPDSSSSPGFLGNPGEPICNFLGSGTTQGGATDGLQGTLYYFPASLNNNSARPDSIPGDDKATHDSYVPGPGGAVALPNPVFFDQINVPTQYYTTGLPISQGTSLNANGAKLIAWFALDFKGKLKLAGAQAGYYQFGLASDDGSILYVDGQPIITMDHTQKTELGVSSRAINLQADQEHTIEILYFQGPPTELAVMLLWRYLGTTDPTGSNLFDEPMVQLSRSESACKDSRTGYGNQCPPNFGSAGIFFDPVNHTPPLAMQAWNDLTGSPQNTVRTRGGWQVIPAENFDLGKQNPCH